jgi:hypothetical protein
MASSGTYEFDITLGELGLYAFNLLGVRPTALTQEHMFTLRIASNMMLLHWGNLGVMLWEVDLQTITLQQGVATYDVPANTFMMLDAYVSSEDNGISPVIDRLVLPISRSEYASYPNKLQEGFPTVFWFDRLLSPTITVWPTPNGAAQDATLSYYRVKQIQDAVMTGGTNMDIRKQWLPAFADGLAANLARSWAPERVADLKAWADMTYLAASNQEVEAGNFYISPQLSSYFRN